MSTRSVRLDGTFTLLSPLSHIGEAISTTTYLVQEPILQEDGTLEEVAVYSGNAWRGQLRDCAASYMLDKLERPDISMDAFHLLFSGGRISGPQKTDLGQSRAFRAAVPMMALWGGGIGNQILSGQSRFGSCYPVCKEASRILPRHMRVETPFAGMTFEKSFSRRDDTKIDTLAPYVPPPARKDLLEAPEGAKKKAKDEVADQMRMTSELLAAGVQLHTWIDALDVDDVQLGCLVSAIHQWSKSPHIGGQASRGHGRVDLSYALHDLDTGEVHEAFIDATNGRCLLSPPAEAAKERYDTHLRDLYAAAISKNKDNVVALLGAA